MRDVPSLVRVVDDEPGMRRLIVELLASVQIPADVHASGEEFLASFDPDRPGCVIMDVRLPDQSGLDVLARLRERGRLPVVIMISGHGDVPMAVRALKLGALDFLEKPFRNQELLDHVQAALARDREDRRRHLQKERVAARLGSLTPREREILDMVVRGEPNKIIAHVLEISAKTVEYHRSNLMRKMESDSVADLVRQVLTHQDP